MAKIEAIKLAGSPGPALIKHREKGNSTSTWRGPARRPARQRARRDAKSAGARGTTDDERRGAVEGGNTSAREIRIDSDYSYFNNLFEIHQTPSAGGNVAPRIVTA